MDLGDRRQNDTIDIHYLDPGGTHFSFVTCMSIPPHRVPSLRNSPVRAFSADGSKFAMDMACGGGVSVWNVQSKAPLRTFTEVPWPKEELEQPLRFFQFSSGNLGKELLVFVEVRLMFTF